MISVRILSLTLFLAILVAGAASSRSLAAAPQRDVPVRNAAELRAAITNAQAGDIITLAPGTYDVVGNLPCRAPGKADAPIVVRAERLGDVIVRMDALEGFHVQGPHWTMENLDIAGVCADDSNCEHAFHIVGAADFMTIRYNRVHGFNAHIKGNGIPGTGVTPFPDDVLVEGNEFFNERARNTSNPVTPIDVVGGRRWVVRANFIHDHQKGGGDHISYAAFLKGNSRDGLFERNLVACELLTTGGIRLGLSFGGGGSGPDRICEDATCNPEHQNGTMRNNLIVNCPADVGIYLNEASGSKLYHNTLYNTTGIDVRFATSDADVQNNLLMGRIRERDGGQATLGTNIQQASAADFARWFADPARRDFTLKDGSQLVDKGAALAAVTDDYCAQARADGKPDLGAVEYVTAHPCDTTRPVTGAGSTPTATPSVTPVASATDGPPTGTATATASVTETPLASATVTPVVACQCAPVLFPWLGATRR
jgi:hypothetical protein